MRNVCSLIIAKRGLSFKSKKNLLSGELRSARHTIARPCKLKLPTGSYPGDNVRGIWKGIVTEGAELSTCCGTREETRIDQRRNEKSCEPKRNSSQGATWEELEELEGQREAKGLKGQEEKETNPAQAKWGASGESPFDFSWSVFNVLCWCEAKPGSKRNALTQLL